MIGIISDTHSRPIPESVLKTFADVEFIIHAGDFCTVKDAKVLGKIKPLKAVFGNMDDQAVRKMFPETQIVEWSRFRIGLYHGMGSPKQVLDYVKEKFAGQKVDAVIFGHSHEAFNKVINGILYFNPGSPNDTCAVAQSYGMLEERSGKLVGKIIKVND